MQPRSYGVNLLAAFLLGLAFSSPAPAASKTPDVITADGASYYGPLVNGQMQGRGRLEWPSGRLYEGDLVRGVYSGQGMLRNVTGEIYRGEFRNGSMHGQGRMELVDGATYTGAFENDYFNGEGRYVGANGETYEGLFKNGQYSGRGTLKVPEYTYTGEFARGRFHGKGRYESLSGDVFEGDFVNGEFKGTGVRTSRDGNRHEGQFAKWRANGPGRYTDRMGNAFEGNFENGELAGRGRATGKAGGVYEGEFRQWRFHGQGVLRHPNGDVYRGNFAGGAYEGEGTLTFAKPQADGTAEVRGTWRYGRLLNDELERKAKANVEDALYNQRALLDAAISRLAKREAGKINMYLLAVGGDGAQEVFRREVEFVQQQFDTTFGTRERSISLVNSRNTVKTMPMATITSIRAALAGIAARMDRENDILFLMLTSHGSSEHELMLNQDAMSLRGLPARELGELVRESGIRWKVIVVSACYSGGFIEHLKDERTLVITAARNDRRSFGCADENDFTHFGRAYFKESLPHSATFQEAFAKATVLVNEWEARDMKQSGQASEEEHSLPQMSDPPAIASHLERWWAQRKRPSAAAK